LCFYKKIFNIFDENIKTENKNKQMKNLFFIKLNLIALITISIALVSCEKEETTTDNEIIKEKTVKQETFVDKRDGKSYKLVIIGNQTWMTENLSYKTTSGSWSYDNDSLNDLKYGRLYNYQTACNTCPQGWHLPTDAEWKTLESYFGINSSQIDLIGLRGTNESRDFISNLNWIPGGYVSGNLFTEKEENMYFWTSSNNNLMNAYYRKISFQEIGIYRNSMSKSSGLSIRCIKDI